MRRALLLVCIVLLAGCSSFVTPAETPANETETTPADTDESEQGTDELIEHSERPDPDSDEHGWENGYWHDDPVAVDASDGLNETERNRTINRAMARVEMVRSLEFKETVNVTVTSRDNYSSGNSSHASEAFRQLDNAKFEALFLIGTQNDSLAEQEKTRHQAVAGFYSPARGDIVVVSDTASPEFDGEATLAHELVHALQDQHFNLSVANVTTRDAYNGRNGLIEGDARTVELNYTDRCGVTWACLPGTSDDGETAEEPRRGSFHLGVYILEYFPYSDGHGFVAALRDEGSWDAVDAAFDSPPSTAATVIDPDRYGQFQPRDVNLTDQTGDGWERVRPLTQADHATLGQSALTAMFAYTIYDDYNQSSVVDPRAFLNVEDGEVNRTDPFNYDLQAVQGWTGDRMHVYQRGSETGYVWRLTWESPTAAQRFADSYEELLAHWGGTEQTEGTWRLPDDSPFTGAIDVTVEGDTVTIVKAPTVESLDGVRRGAG